MVKESTYVGRKSSTYIPLDVKSVDPVVCHMCISNVACSL